MDMAAAEVKRAALAQPHSSDGDPNGSEIIVRCLQAEGVKYVWGYPGGAVLYIYDALYKQDSIDHSATHRAGALGLIFQPSGNCHAGTAFTRSPDVTSNSFSPTCLPSVGNFAAAAAPGRLGS